MADKNKDGKKEDGSSDLVGKVIEGTASGAAGVATTAFIAWVVYAGYLHARSTAGWRGRRAAVVNVVGFAVMVFNLFFVNLVVTGLHSYAGVG